MEQKTKTELMVEKAYAVMILLDHSRWAKVPNSGGAKAPRKCMECAEVISVGYDPNGNDMASHSYDMLVKAGLVWSMSPARVDGVDT